MSYYISKFTRAVLYAGRAAQYRRHFTQCGPGFEPMGKMILVNEGTLIAGSELSIRTYAYLPVEIRIKPKGRLVIGNNVTLNVGVRIGCSLEITIGDSCLIGDEVLIFDSDWHGVGGQPTRTEAVHIGNRVWVAARSMILRGVTLGEGCVVAAGSVVTHSVDPYTVVAGVPAKCIRNLA
jgi:acetyltransferase-like isoleucine patch superfamily enzyme